MSDEIPRRSSQPPSRISTICDAIRTHLEEKDLTRYVNSILTAHVVKSPPSLEAALGLLARLKGAEANTVEDFLTLLILQLQKITPS